MVSQVNLNLTTRQEEILSYIRWYFDEHGYAPSKPDIANYFGFGFNAAVDHVKVLEKKGWLSTTPKTARSIVLLK